jgi:hypothetical protein
MGASSTDRGSRLLFETRPTPSVASTRPDARLPRTCHRCGSSLPSSCRRRRYCSAECLRLAALAISSAWKRAYRMEHGYAAYGPRDYWSDEKRREKGREYTARWRAKKRLCAAGTRRVA